MKLFLSNLDTRTRHRLEWVLDALSLGAVLQYAAYRFLQSTMFNFYYSNMYKLITMGLLLVFGGIRYLYVLCKKWSEKDNKERKRFLLNCGFAWLLALPFCYVGWKHDYKFLIFLPICCMCLYDMDADKACRWFSFTIGTLLTTTVLCCLSGTVRNVVSAWGSEEGAFAYGTINTTDFASYFTFLLVTIWCAFRSTNWFQNLLFATISVVVSYIVFSITGSRTALYSGIIICFFVVWDGYTKRSDSSLKPLRKGIHSVAISAFPVLCGIVILLVVLYGAQNPIVQKMDDVLSERIKVAWEPYQRYGIHLFGSLIEKMHGNGGTSIQYWTSGYGYIDIAYAMLFIRYGWIIGLIFAGLWIWLSKRSIEAGKTKIAYALAILALHAFSEARILDINYNIFLAMPFCALQSKRDEKKSENKKIYWFPLLSGGVLLIGVWLVLPRALSWLRTFFFLKQWNHGTAALNSLLVSATIVISICVLWRALCRIRAKKEKAYYGLLVVTIVTIVSCAILINGTIESGIKERGEQINGEEKIIAVVKKAATLPVYAADSEELYRRSIGPLSDHIFSNEELSRPPRGSIFTDNSVELFEAGYYTQISESTGLYSFDEAVINELSEKGFSWTEYYSGTHRCNLRDTAIFNGLKPAGSLIIQGPKTIVTKDMEGDQEAGKYVVSLRIKNLKESSFKTIVFEIYGEDGERLITKDEINLSALQDGDIYDYSLPYEIFGTPKLHYAITVPENQEIAIEDISWQRVE